MKPTRTNAALQIGLGTALGIAAGFMLHAALKRSTAKGEAKYKGYVDRADTIMLLAPQLVNAATVALAPDYMGASNACAMATAGASLTKMLNEVIPDRGARRDEE